MSYILSALRKADQDSKRREDPDGTVFDGAAWQAPVSQQSLPTQSKWVVMVIALLVVIVVLLVFLLLRGVGKTPQAPLVSQPTHVETAPLQTSTPAGDTLVNDNPVPVASESNVGPVVNAGVTSVRETSSTPAVSVSSSLSNGPVELPEISGHLFIARDPTLSRLFGTNGTYRVGHKFDNGLELTAITKTLAIFEKNGQQYELVLGN